MKRSDVGFTLIEVLIASAITAVVVAATWAVVGGVLRSDDDSRIRLQLQMDAATALRKISDLLKMAGPTGTVTQSPGPSDVPVFAVDQMGGGFTGNWTFINSTTYQTSPQPGATTITNDGVGHLAPPTDTDGYYGTSNEIAFKLPRPSPWITPGSAASTPAVPDNPIDNTGVPVDTNGNTTWGMAFSAPNVNGTQGNLYQWYLQNMPAGYAARQTDVYAIVLVPTTTFGKDVNGNPIPGQNQLELREFNASLTTPQLIRRTVLASGVERIVFQGPFGSPYYLTGTDPLTGLPFSPAPVAPDPGLGMNQLRVTIWMWANALNKNTKSINAYRCKQSITINLRSVGENQLAN